MLAICFCLLVAALGALGVVAPSRFVVLLRRLTRLEGYYQLAVLRIAFGAALYLAAPGSRAPTLLQVLGIISIVAGTVTPFFGHQRYREVVDWWSSGGDLYIRVWCGCTLVLGLTLAYAAMPRPQ